jgi:acyl-homoserine lactone acylase PvdQ
MGVGLASIACLAAASPASAQLPLPDLQPPDPGGFRNVLPGGQGETVSSVELVATGDQSCDREDAGGPPPCDSFTDQIPLYDGLISEAPMLEPADLRDLFKSERFGLTDSQVAPEQTVVLPGARDGVTIVRDRTYQVPHVFGETRADTMYGAGYATAQDRLFLMDVLRHTGRARLTELIGPGEGNSTVKMDAAQLKIADYSEQELQQMIDTAAASAGAEGRQIKRDLLNYVDGVNRYITEARANPDKLPVEYAALQPEGPENWKPTDTVAVASLIGGIFGRGGGSEALVSQALAAAERRFQQAATARGVFRDFRRQQDPEAPVTTTKRFPFDDPQTRDPDAVAVPDLRSIVPRDPIISSSSDMPGTSAESWVQGLQQNGLTYPEGQSNALLIPADHSATGNPLAVMGPQVGYYSPEILMELDLHGGGIDARGATFPGISLYVLLGRGRDYAWSATTATTDNVDEFVEVLCEPDGSQPTMSSSHYRYKGRCRPFERRRHVLRTGVIPTDPEGSNQEYVLRVERSVHGPIQARARVDGRPVAIAEARSTYFHELESALAFKRLNGNEVTGPGSFQRTMDEINFAFNWFYVDDQDVSFFQSGWFPRRAEGTAPSLPAYGTGAWDWQGFDPGSFTSRRMSFEEKPRDTNPERGYLVNWNNKQAPGWRAADDNLAYGSVHRSERLEDRVNRELDTGPISLTELTRVMGLAATVDLRGQESYPLLRTMIGRVPEGSRADQVLRFMDRWVAAGAHRRDLNGNNVLEHSPAIAVMDEWWPRLVRRMFRPTLGKFLLNRIERVNDYGDPPSPGGSSFFNGWWGYVDKDLRTLLGRDVQQPLSQTYCGGHRDRAATRERCAERLVKTLVFAATRAEERYGVERLREIERPATCAPDPTYPRTCDQIEFITAGALPTEPIHWQDRPTFQQIVEVGAP